MNKVLLVALLSNGITFAMQQKPNPQPPALPLTAANVAVHTQQTSSVPVQPQPTDSHSEGGDTEPDSVYGLAHPIDPMKPEEAR